MKKIIDNRNSQNATQAMGGEDLELSLHSDGAERVQRHRKAKKTLIRYVIIGDLVFFAALAVFAYLFYLDGQISTNSILITSAVMIAATLYGSVWGVIKARRIEGDNLQILSAHRLRTGG